MSDVQTPSRPFPSQATFTLDAGFEAGDAMVFPTLMVPAVADLRGFLGVFLDRFGEEGATRGQSVVVRGEHGAGKTHALGFAMRQIAADPELRGNGVRDVLQLYAKAEEPGLEGIYRTLMTQVGSARLRDLAVRYTAEITADVIAATLADEKTAQEIRTRIRADPAMAAALMHEYYVDQADVLARRDEEMARLTSDSPNFANAFAWITSDVGDVAYRWFIGETLDADDLRALGVTSVIASPQMAKLGLQLLAAVCARTGTALIVYVDQYEKVILGPAGKLDRPAAGIIHSLAEVLPHQDAALVIAGNMEAYEAMPVDLQQRFGSRVVECRGLDRRQAATLVNLYLRPRQEAPDNSRLSSADIEPFTFEGLEALRVHSWGNPRRLLELCAIAFAGRPADELIDERVARDATEAAGVPVVNGDVVLEHARDVAKRLGFTVARSQEPVDGKTTEALRLAGPQGDLRFEVVLGRSQHYYDEIEDARGYVDAAERLREAQLDAAVIVLLLGYETPEVRKLLSDARVRVLVYDSRTFDDDFEALLNDRVQTDPVRDADDRLTVRQVLDELQSRRETDAQGLTAKAQVLGEREEDEHLAERWRAAETEWAGERRRLEERIAEARGQRRADALAGLERLRAHAERERSRRVTLRWVAFAAAVLAAAIGTAYGLRAGWDYRADTYRSYPWAVPVAIAGWVGILLAAASLYLAAIRSGRWSARDRVLRKRDQRELATPVSSMEDLRHVTYSVAAKDGVRLRYVIQHANPQFRYIAALIAESFDDVRLLARALPGERSSIVRQAFARRVGREPDIADIVTLDLLDAETPEVVYVFEGVVDRSPLTPRGRGTEPLNALAALYVADPHLLPAARLIAQHAGPAVAESLNNALEAGMPVRYRAQLTRVPAEAIRLAARSLSPFEAGGLGTFDELALINDVDRAFLDLTRVLFFVELGLLTP